MKILDSSYIGQLEMSRIDVGLEILTKSAWCWVRIWIS